MSAKPHIWSGEHNFAINGSGMHEDTLRIVPNYEKSEQMYKLQLPTLCITYADMKFQNDIGGMQINYPGSAIYGPGYFDPPVVLTGDDIEKFTYIRGAYRVTIGSDKTVVEFPSWEELVIPRLRIDEKPDTPGSLAVDSARIEVETPLQLVVKQYADGRHVGGITLESRHPKYVEPKVEPSYDLWIRVIDAKIKQPLQEAVVDIWCWDPGIESRFGRGDFVPQSHHYTNGEGIVELKKLAANELQWYTVRLPGWRVSPRCMRPLPGQAVRLHMNAWKIRKDDFRYIWKRHDDLKKMAELSHIAAADILELNHIRGPGDLRPEMEITLPNYLATYRPENWETLYEIAERFGFENVRELAQVNGWSDIKQYNGAIDLKLPEWRFLHARKKDSLIPFDKLFDLPAGSSRPAHRVYRPRSDALLPTEVVAVPSVWLAEKLKKGPAQLGRKWP